MLPVLPGLRVQRVKPVLPGLQALSDLRELRALRVLPDPGATSDRKGLPEELIRDWLQTSAFPVRQREGFLLPGKESW